MGVSLSHDLGANELRPSDLSQIDSSAPKSFKLISVADRAVLLVARY